MFENLKKFWKKYGFIIIVVLSIISLFIFWYFNDKKGTYFNDVSLNNFTPKIPPQCRRGPKESKGESKCREVLEKLFAKPFPNTRPEFLKNLSTGKNMEIDCYNEELGIALEMQGIQHYKFSPWFHKSKQDFLDQQYRDKMKRQICEERGLIFIEVPYTVKHENIENFIKIKLEKYGLTKF